MKTAENNSKQSAAQVPATNSKGSGGISMPAVSAIGSNDLAESHPFQLSALSPLDMHANTDSAIQPSAMQLRRSEPGTTDSLKTGVEQVSVMDLGEIKTNYTPRQPAQLYAFPSTIKGHPVFQLTAKEAVPATPAWEDNANGAKAGAPEIQNKKNHANALAGSVPRANPVGWDTVLSSAAKVKGSWVRFHLINHNIGGSGTNTNNLVPTSHAINTGAAWGGFEDDVKAHYNNNEWVWCKTSVTYDASYPNGFPKQIKGEAQYYDAKGAAWTNAAKNNTVLDISKPDFGAGPKTRTLDEMTASTWALLTGLGAGTKVVRYLNGLSSDCKGIEDFNERLYSMEAPDGIDEIQGYIDLAIKGKHRYVNLAVDY